MEKKNYDLIQFIVGLAMLVVGFYLFANKVVVSTGFGFFVGGASINGGLVVIPMLIGVVWWFINPKAVWAKILTGLGLVLIVASVVVNTRFYFHDSLYNYIIMLVLIVGGAGLLIKVLFKKPKDDK